MKKEKDKNKISLETAIKRIENKDEVLKLFVLGLANIVGADLMTFALLYAPQTFSISNDGALVFFQLLYSSVAVISIRMFREKNREYKEAKRCLESISEELATKGYSIKPASLQKSALLSYHGPTRANFYSIPETEKSYLKEERKQEKVAESSSGEPIYVDADDFDYSVESIKDGFPKLYRRS